MIKVICIISIRSIWNLFFSKTENRQNQSKTDHRTRRKTD